MDMKWARGVRAPLIAGLLSSVVLAGCSVATGTSTDSSGAPDGSGGSEYSLAKGYGSLTQLANDSELIVQGQVVGEVALVNADKEGVLTERVPVYEFRVETSFKGTAPETVRVRGYGTDPSQDFPVLTSGPTYILYLTTFAWSDNEPTDQYMMVGQQGAYEVRDSTAVRVGKLGDLPMNESVEDLVANTG